jgi:hypothetical protein
VAEGNGRTKDMAGRRGAVAAVVEVRRGRCSSRGGWNMRATIGAGDGWGVHSAFYRAEEGVWRQWRRNGSRRVTCVYGHSFAK